MKPEEQTLFRALLILSCCAVAIGAIWIGMGEYNHWYMRRQLRKEKKKDDIFTAAIKQHNKGTFEAPKRPEYSRPTKPKQP